MMYWIIGGLTALAYQLAEWYRSTPTSKAEGDAMWDNSQFGFIHHSVAQLLSFAIAVVLWPIALPFLIWAQFIYKPNQ